MKGHRFKSAAEVKQWLLKVQHVVPWKDVAAKEPTFVETRVSYPIKIKLPAQVEIYGPVTVYLSTPGQYLLALSPAQIRQIQKVADYSGHLRVSLDYYPTDSKFGPCMGFEICDKKVSIRFQTGLRFEDVEESRSILSEMFQEFGVAVRMRKVTQVKHTYRTVPVTFYGISEGFELVASPKIGLKQCAAGLAPGINPYEVEFTWAGSLAEALQKFNRLRQRHKWRIGKCDIVFRAEGKQFEGRPDKARHVVELLNSLEFPCKRAELELWYSLKRWQDFPVLQKIAPMDMEGSPAETNIFGIDLGQGLKGFVEVSATAKTFTTAAVPGDDIQDHSRRGQFYAEWKKKLAQLK